MNAHQSLRQSVGRTLLAQVFNNDQLVNLFTISDIGTANAKLDADARPTFDTALRTAGSDGLFTKSTTPFLPRLQAEQIARSNGVDNGTIPFDREFDTTLTFLTVTPTLPRTITFNQMVELNNLDYLIDIEFNNGTALNLTTSDRDLIIQDGFYGNLLSTSTTYTSNADILALDATGNSIRDSIRDGIPGDGITLSSSTAGLTNAIQTNIHINGKINIRGVGVRQGHTLWGPVRLANLTIDGASQVLDTNNNRSTITLSTIKNWDQVKNQYGGRTADAIHLSRFPNDTFFAQAADVGFTKLWKERD